MSFHWSHYLVVARELLGDADNTEYREANLRCTISRAYYAIFHHARHKLRDEWNIPVSENAGAHAQIQNFFKQRGEKDVSRKLNWMRAVRNKADYDDQFSDLENTAQEILRLSGEIIEALNIL